MFLVVSRLEAHFACELPSLQFYLRVRKIGRLERNLTTPALVPENTFIKRNN